MKHGPIALIDERMPVLVLCAKGESYEKTISNLEEAHARGGKVIAVGTEGDESLWEKAEDVLFLPACGRYARPIMEVIPLQLLAYYMAVMKGTDVDQPRNLAKIDRSGHVRRYANPVLSRIKTAPSPPRPHNRFNLSSSASEFFFITSMEGRPSCFTMNHSAVGISN